MASPHATPQEHCEPSRSAVRAAVSLLSDPDPRVVQACRAQLLEWGEISRELLAEASEGGDSALRVRARDLLRSLDMQAWLRAVRELPLDSAPRDADGLLRSIALVGRGLDPFGPDLDRLRARFEEAAVRLRPQVAGRTASTCARLLAEEVLGMGLDGARGVPAARDNLLVHRIWDSGRGTPVALSLIYLVLGRMSGLSMAGVGIPDHLLVRVHGVRPVLLDPFHGGRTVTKVDCVRYLRSAGYDNPVSEYLRDLADREVLALYLRSLLHLRRDVDPGRPLERALAFLERD